MKKALILTGFNPYSTTGGVETFTQTLIDLLNSSDVKPELVCASDFENVYNLKHKFIGQVYAAGRSLLSPDSTPYEFALSNGYYGGGFFPKKLKTYAVFHSTHAGYAEAIRSLIPRSTYLEIRYLVGELLERSSAAGARIVAVSKRIKSELNEYYGLEEVDVVDNPVDTEFFSELPGGEGLRTKYSIPLHRKVGLFVGRWEISKGIDILQKIKKDLKDIFWVIVTSSGAGAPPAEENTLVLSGLNKAQMREIYSLSDFMLFPSRYEGFGLAAAEAMTCGLPVIGTRVGFLEEVYDLTPFSRVSVPPLPQDVNDIAFKLKDAINKLFSDEHLCEEISEKGRDIITRNHNLSRWKERMKNILCLN